MVCGLLVVVVSLVVDHRSQELWLMGLTSPRHVGSSWTGDGTCVSCIGRQILNHWSTREVPSLKYLNCIWEAS